MRADEDAHMVMVMSRTDAGKTALVVAHPGHELRIHGLLGRWQPTVFILTDGSGRTGRSRLGASRKVIERAGASPGEIFGRFSDTELYATLLSRDFAPFVEIVGRLADSFVRADVERVLGDASEGYNPAHEVCRLVIDAAIARARTLTGVSIENWAFSLAGPPKPTGPAVLRSLRVPLTSQEFATKIEAAGGYEELDEEVGALSRTTGPRPSARSGSRKSGRLVNWKVFARWPRRLSS